MLLGGAAIRQIVFDPILPAPLVDPRERRAFVETMCRFDEVGRQIWRRLFGVGLGTPDHRTTAESLLGDAAG